MNDTLEALRFDNTFVRELPADPVADNYRRQVARACYSRVSPTPVGAPHVLAFSPEVARLFDLSPDALTGGDAAALLSGNRVSAGMATYAACYGGHQFGNWAGQLGDGRAADFRGWQGTCAAHGGFRRSERETSAKSYRDATSLGTLRR